MTQETCTWLLYSHFPYHSRAVRGSTPPLSIAEFPCRVFRAEVCEGGGGNIATDAESMLLLLVGTEMYPKQK